MLYSNRSTRRLVLHQDTKAAFSVLRDACLDRPQEVLLILPLGRTLMLAQDTNGMILRLPAARDQRRPQSMDLKGLSYMITRLSH